MNFFKLSSICLIIGSFIIFFGFVGACKESSEVEQEAKNVTKTPPVIADISGRDSLDVALQNVTELKEEKTELETRLEALISLIEQKENALFAREQKLLEREQRLIAEYAALDDREQSVKGLQIISWIVLLVGVVAIGVAFVLLRKALEKPSKKTVKTKQKSNNNEKQATDSKADYIKKIEIQLNEWEGKIAELKTKAAKTTVKQDSKKQLDELTRKLKTTEKKLQEVKNAGEDAWKDLTDGVDKAAGDMMKALEKAVEKVR